MTEAKQRIRNLVVRSLLMTCLVIFRGLQIEAAEMEVGPGVKGVWFQPGETLPRSLPWQAQWIWMDERVTSDMMLARKSFDLPDAPDSAYLRITATSQYQLFVNGIFVCHGPARCAPHHQAFDWLDVGPLLRKGGNTIAVRVHYLQGIVSYHHRGRGGLLAQLDLGSGDGTTTVITDSSWRVHPDPAWIASAPRMNRFHLEVSDRKDFRSQIHHWWVQDFDDTAWSSAKPLQRNTGWPEPAENERPRALTPPWTSLVLRDIPYLIETVRNGVDLLEARTILPDVAGPVGFEKRLTPDLVTLSNQLDQRIAGQAPTDRTVSGPLLVPALERGSRWFLLFDFGKVLNARPRLDIEGAAGTWVELTSVPYILDHQFRPSVVDSDFRDLLVLSGERDLWEACYLRPVRFLSIVIHGTGEPVRIHRVGVREVEYPFSEKGRFRAAQNAWLEQCWGASAKTIRVCTTDAYTDNYRERRQYAQTGYYAALGNYAVFGDTVLQRRYLRQIAEEQQGNGIMPAYAPSAGDDYMVILDSNCLWVRSLRDYLLYSGDEETVRALLPPALKLMELFQAYTDHCGLLECPPYPYWLDHALNDRRGANFCMNGHYLGALESFVQVLRWLEEPGAEHFQSRVEKLRSALQSLFWDPQRRLFADAWIDGKRSAMFSEHANAMALAMNVATEKQAEAIADALLTEDEHNFIKRASGITMVTPAMSYFLHSGLCKYGYVKGSLRLLQRRFDHMLRDGPNGTLWEEWWLDATGRSGILVKGRTRSDAQTESAFPPALFTEFVLGIRPTEPGLREVVVSRHSTGLREIEGEIPSPFGNLALRWDLEIDGTGELLIEIPRGMRAKIDLSSLAPPKGEGVSVDGKVLESSVRSVKYAVLEAGKHEVTF